MNSRHLVYLIFGLILGLILLVGAYRASEVPNLEETKQTDAEAVYAQPLKRQRQEIRETFYGLIEPSTRVDMAFQISGRITQLGNTKANELDEGLRVRKGEVIAKLEHDRYEAQLSSAIASKEQAAASKAAAEATITDANARLEDAQLERNRVDSLYKKNAATKRELERADLAVKLAQAAVETANAGKLEAIAAYDTAEAARLVAAVNLKDTMLLSPINGTVAYVPSELGQMVTPSDNVVTIVDINNVDLVVGVVERKLGLLRVGQLVNVEVEALRSSPLRPGTDSVENQTIHRKGRVAVIPPIADDKTGLFNVEIEIENQDRLLRPGMIGKAEIVVRQLNAYAVPIAAGRRLDDRVTAFIVQEQADQPIAKKITFEPDFIRGDAYLVADLPAEANQIIVEGVTGLTDGQPITIISQPTADNQTVKPSVTISASENAAPKAQ